MQSVGNYAATASILARCRQGLERLYICNDDERRVCARGASKLSRGCGSAGLSFTYRASRAVCEGRKYPVVEGKEMTCRRREMKEEPLLRGEGRTASSKGRKNPVGMMVSVSGMQLSYIILDHVSSIRRRERVVATNTRCLQMNIDVRGLRTVSSWCR